MRKEQLSEESQDAVPTIDNLILIDRQIDPITPLVTQLTYEGLIDEMFGIKHGAVRLPAHRKGTREEMESRCIFRWVREIGGGSKILTIVVRFKNFFSSCSATDKQDLRLKLYNKSSSSFLKLYYCAQNTNRILEPCIFQRVVLPVSCVSIPFLNPFQVPLRRDSDRRAGRRGRVRLQPVRDRDEDDPTQLVRGHVCRHQRQGIAGLQLPLRTISMH